MAKNIASSETTMVKRPNGKGSNAIVPAITSVLTKIQAVKKITWKTKKAVEPQISVKSSAIWVKSDRDLKDFASKGRIHTVNC